MLHRCLCAAHRMHPAACRPAACICLLVQGRAHLRTNSACSRLGHAYAVSCLGHTCVNVTRRVLDAPTLPGARVDGGKNPVWHETFLFERASTSFFLKLQFYDKNTITKDVFIGECKIPLIKALRTRPQDIHVVPVVTKEGTVQVRKGGRGK
eukprot:358404-Chlamydomonas_euryale.AAC.1